ncbi:MAG TPA: DUF5329 domain-containing protein [Povalibacter sp.]|nr:DUF5329 domain-containing protein [Povalibacter sp.]
MKQTLMCVAMALSFASPAAESEADARQEIEHLIGYLGSSGCQFNRNGTWYDASTAVGHLSRKYAVLSDKKLVPTAEAFIEKAASSSSASGKPYHVRCPGKAEIPSGEWFHAELERFRAASHP